MLNTTDYSKMLAVKVFLCVLLVTALLIQDGDAGWLRARIRWTRITRRTMPCFTGRCFSREKVGNLCEDLDKAVIKREQWRAVEPRHVEYTREMPDNVAIRHTGPETCQLIGLSRSNCQRCIEEEACLKDRIATLQAYDLSEGYDDIKYNFLIGQDGEIYEGRGWGVVGQHASDQNIRSLGIAMIGDFTDTEPSQASQNALKNLITCGQSAKLLSRAIDFITGPDTSGKAIFEMIQRCNGLCSD